MAQRIWVETQPSRPVPSIKYFGTTWYERRTPYWRRRIWLAALALVLLLAVAGGVALLVLALFDRFTSIGGRVGVVGVAAIPIAWSCISAYRKLRRSPGDRAAHRPMSFAATRVEQVRGGGAAGVAAGSFASAGSPLASGLLAVGSLFIVGQAIGFLLITLGKYVNDEEWRLARQYGLEE